MFYTLIKQGFLTRVFDQSDHVQGPIYILIVNEWTLKFIINIHYMYDWDLAYHACI